MDVFPQELDWRIAIGTKWAKEVFQYQYHWKPFGVPAIILSDQGSHFVKLADHMSLMGIWPAFSQATAPSQMGGWREPVDKCFCSLVFFFACHYLPIFFVCTTFLSQLVIFFNTV